jgi:hypothetical protein
MDAAKKLDTAGKLGLLALEATLKRSGWYDKVHERLLRSASDALEPGERPIAIAQTKVGRRLLKMHALMLTDRRLIFHTLKLSGLSVGDLDFTVPRSDIASAEWNKAASSRPELKIERSDGRSLRLQFLRASREPGAIIGESLSGAPKPLPELSNES